MDKSINELLEEKYARMVRHYGENNVFGVFCTGSWNYGVGVKEQPYLPAIIIPTFDEVCKTRPVKNEEEDVVDIRLFYESMLHADINALEFLFCPCKVNEKYYELFSKLLVKREEIGRCCEDFRYRFAYLKAKEAFDRGEFKEGYRLVMAARKYHAGESVDSCFHLSTIEKEIIEKTDFTEDDNRPFQLLKEVALYVNTAEPNNCDASKLIKQIILDIMHTALSYNVDRDAFEETLSAQEHEALELIRGEIGNCGHVVISKLVASSKLSKYVFRRVLDKMIEYNVAEVEANGAKGTYIKFKI